MSAFIFVEVSSYICAPFSIGSNILLLMIIRNTTSRQLAPFKLPLATFALSCIILSATFVLCQPCVLLQNDVILIVLMGPAIFIHPAISSICFVIFQATLILCTLQVASPYLFKILAKKDKITPLWQIVSLAVPFVMTWLVLIVPLVVFSFKSYGEIYDRKEAYQRIVSAYTNLNWTPYFVTYKLNVIDKLWLILLVVVCTIGCISVAVSTTRSSELLRTLKLHKWATYAPAGFGQIANTSRLNACSVAVLVLAPMAVFVICAVSGQQTYSYSIPLFLGCAFIPIVNAYFVLFNIRSFRKAMTKMIALKSKSIGTISHISSDH